MKETLPAFMTDPTHEYYVSPDVFTKKTPQQAFRLRTEERTCRYCSLPFRAKWRIGKGPQHCSQACIKLKAAQDHKAWKARNMDHFRKLCRESQKRTVKRSYTRKISLKPKKL